MTMRLLDPLLLLLASPTDPELAGTIQLLKGVACNTWLRGLLRHYRRAA